MIRRAGTLLLLSLWCERGACGWPKVTETGREEVAPGGGVDRAAVDLGGVQGAGAVPADSDRKDPVLNPEVEAPGEREAGGHRGSDAAVGQDPAGKWEEGAGVRIRWSPAVGAPVGCTRRPAPWDGARENRPPGLCRLARSVGLRDAPPSGRRGKGLERQHLRRWERIEALRRARERWACDERVLGRGPFVACLRAERPASVPWW